MWLPLFPSLIPRSIDPAWFNVDQPCDDEKEVEQLEREHQEWLTSISQKNCDLPPIGINACDNEDQDDDDEDEDDNDDDEESETHGEEEEDEVNMEVSQERNLLLDVSIRMGPGHAVR